MRDIFISYKSEEQEKARQLVDALERQGWRVWWDPKLRAGEHFDEVIEAALEETKCAVVLWSPLSVKSRWIRDEATYALTRNKLVPVMIEDVELPLRFVSIETRRLVGWGGSEDSPEFRRLVEDIEGIVGPSPASVAEAKRRAEKERIQSETERKLKEEERRRQEAAEDQRRKAIEERKRQVDAKRVADEKQRRGAEQEAKRIAEEEKIRKTEEQSARQEASKTPKDSHFFGGLICLLAAAIPVLIWYINEGSDQYFRIGAPILLFGCTAGGFIFHASRVRTAMLVCAGVAAVAMGMTYGVTGRIAYDPGHLLWIPLGAVIWGFSAAVIASLVNVIRMGHSG